MITTSLITQIYLAQRDIYKTYHDTDELQRYSHETLCLEKKLRAKLECTPDLLKLYDELDDIQTQYLCAAEENAYRFGFKTALKIAIEANMD